MKPQALLFLVPILAAAAACDDFGPAAAKGELSWNFDRDSEAFTKAQAEVPDSNDFILKVTDPKGEVLYEGPFGESPTSLLVQEGSYTVSAVSAEFTAPGFAKPQYGDEQVIVVKAGDNVHVRLNCTLQNCGVKLKIAPDFLTSYPDGVMYVGSDEGRLMYAYTEKRIAYFHPGKVFVQLHDSGEERTLITRNLSPREILTVSISAPGGGKAAGSSISVAVDTTKIWSYEDYVIGGSNSGGGGKPEDGDHSGIENAFGVADAASHVGAKDVWMFGYIVGGDLTTTGASVKTSKVTKSTHIAVAARASVTDKASCVAVELPKGAVRDALNLVDHPDLVGSRVYLKGNIVEKYFGTTGMKGVTDFVLK